MKLIPFLLTLIFCALLHGADRLPEVVKQVPPIYPPWLIGPEIGQGEVLVGFVVTKEGRTTDVTVVRSVHPLLGPAAVAAVKQWRFRPGQKDGVPVSCSMQVPIVFVIEGFLGENYLSGHFTCLNSVEGAELPTLVVAVSPVYPGKHWRKGVDGTVAAEFGITPEGKTCDIRIVSASLPEFADSVVKAIPGFRFIMDPSYVGTPRVRLDLEFMSPVTQAKKASNNPSSASQAATVKH